MQKFNVPLGGITNVPDDNFSQDGDMQLLLNMRNEGGELTVMRQPNSVKLLVERVTDAKYHAQSEKWLEIVNNSKLGYGYETAMPITIYTVGDDEVLTDILMMGNIVSLLRTVKGAVAKPVYIKWNGNDFDVLGVFPDIPELEISVANGSKMVDTSQSYYDGTEEMYENENNELLWSNASKGYFDKCLSLLYSDAMFVDRTLLRVAFRLFDGSVVEHSRVYYVENNDTLLAISGTDKTVGKDSNNFVSVKYSSGSRSKYKVAIAGFKIGVMIKRGIDLSAWEDVITAVEVYATPSIMGHKADNSVQSVGTQWQHYANVIGSVNVYTSEAYERYRALTSGEIADATEGADMFYKYMVFDLRGNEDWRLKNTSPSEMAVQDRLGVNEMPHTVLPIRGTMNYNSKIHYNGVQEIMHVPYNVGVVKRESFSLEEGLVELTQQVTQVSVIVKIQTEKGVKTVVENYYNVKVSEVAVTGGYDFGISGYLSYPDSRAKEMEVIVHRGKNHSSLDSYWGRSTFVLKAHNSLNLAYCIGPELGEEAVATGVGYNVVKCWETASSDVVIANDGGTFEVNPAYAKNDDMYMREETMKVSAVDNPFFFPAAQTYKFEGAVVGAASNTEAVSQGQFGQYPLYVFTDKGIWMLSVDTSGKGAYTMMSPISREVCTGALCPVSGGVAFTTDRAVMIISGSEVMDISAAIDGDKGLLANYSNKLYTEILRRAGVTETLNVEPIREYLKKYYISLAYNGRRGELYLTSSSWRTLEFKYSYVYSLKSQKWGIADFVFSLTTNSYPGLVVYDEATRLAFEDSSTVARPVVAISRPIKLGTTGYKRLRQAALRGTFKGALDFYLFGSKDAANWVLLGGKELVDGEHRDIVTQMFRSKQYRFLAFAVVGNITGRLSMVEMMADGAFADNRL